MLAGYGEGRFGPSRLRVCFSCPSITERTSEQGCSCMQLLGSLTKQRGALIGCVYEYEGVHCNSTPLGAVHLRHDLKPCTTALAYHRQLQECAVHAPPASPATGH